MVILELYGLDESEDPSLSDFSDFHEDLEDESSRVILRDLITELEARLKSMEIAIRVSTKWTWTRRFRNRFTPNCKTVSVTEVKDEDFYKGIAQNAVQLESALSNRKRKANEMEEDSVFVDRLRFKLSELVVVVYKDENMENMVRKVLGHIAEKGLEQNSSDRPSLSIIRNLGYKFLRNLDDELVRDKEIPELGPCSECTNDILALPLKGVHCPFIVDIIYPISTSTRRGSQSSSQSSGTSALSNLVGEKFFLTSPTIPEDPMDVENAVFQQTESRVTCAKCVEEITLDFPKDTVILKSDLGPEVTNQTYQPKSHRAKKPKRLMRIYFEELSSETSKLRKRELSFGKAFDRYFNNYKKDNPKRTAQALINKEVRKQLFDTVSDDVLRKKKERALKIFELFSEIGEDKIQRIKSFTSAISKLKSR
ncbi:hypothetical protein GLOIN_2v1788173 [Rhizophagus clarus]|uniref:Uncharacterized protein n=1 Tax=Rhizophagus clarus TaxID=94130 RepID=A0A8H3LXJ6_9GLOM|nr:hypothetical protein GLOIN_2v1788173 [Rhizophagus clarus]